MKGIQSSGHYKAVKLYTETQTERGMGYINDLMINVYI